MIPRSASGTLKPSINDRADTITLALPARNRSSVCALNCAGSSLCSHHDWESIFSQEAEEHDDFSDAFVKQDDTGISPLLQSLLNQIPSCFNAAFRLIKQLFPTARVIQEPIGDLR